MDVYFFTGTGTDVGKTYCAAHLAGTCHKRGLSVGVYKPVASGCEVANDGERVAPDAKQLWEAAGRPLTLHTVCPQRFEAAVAPPEAAKLAGETIDEVLLVDGVKLWSDRECDVLIVEGAGGLFSPISDSMLNIDFVHQLRRRLPQMQSVLVAPNRLGVIHDTVACVNAANAAGLQIERIVLNTFPSSEQSEADESTQTNADLIQRWTGCQVIHDAGKLASTQ
ncbi:dethiobiotin synthase [Rhodopirellula sallentina]|uniref:ATP-dependent dethiobiotin synthetase BioD n=1 Tax=Rhodopirellula sallentina SM41 TaxID=1263870 RepID=M5UFQ5_9BACT|nr:dethiobiotin synthase [Rhodopirellula sallentina]EMI54833.1 dethiobiotin synthetase [Rhodopirellula sallentina SM41]